MVFDSNFRKMLSLFETVWACDSIFFLRINFVKSKKTPSIWKPPVWLQGIQQLPSQEVPGSGTCSSQLTEKWWRVESGSSSEQVKQNCEFKKEHPSWLIPLLGRRWWKWAGAGDHWQVHRGSANASPQRSRVALVVSHGCHEKSLASVACLCLICISLILAFSDLQDPVECLARHPHGPPFSSSSNAIPVAPPATIVSQISSAFSFAEPLAHPVVTQSPHSPTGVIPLPSPQPSAPITSSPAIDMPLPSGTVSSPKPPPDLPLTLSPGKSSAPSPTMSAPVNVNTTGIPPDKTGKYDKPHCSHVFVIRATWNPAACQIMMSAMRPH